jgi:hypothetical protein
VPTVKDKIVFSLRLGKDIYEEIRQRARDLGISANDFIRMSLAKEIEQKELSKTGTDRS